MGRGRKAVPVEEHLRRGTYNATRHGNSVQVERGMPAKPDELTEEESATWDKLAMTYLDRLALTDGGYLTRLAKAEVREARLREEVQAEGETYKTKGRNGDMVHANPKVAMLDRQVKSVLDLHAHFGGSPSTRMKIPKLTPVEENPWSDIGVRAN